MSFVFDTLHACLHQLGAPLEARHLVGLLHNWSHNHNDVLNMDPRLRKAAELLSAVILKNEPGPMSAIGVHDLREPKPLQELLTEDELKVIYFMEKLGTSVPGSFTTSLIECIAHADPENAMNLRRGFPGLVDAVLDFKFGNLHERAVAQLSASVEKKGAKKNVKQKK